MGKLLVNRDLRGQLLTLLTRLESLAWAVTDVGMQQLELVCDDLRDGVDVGCQGVAHVGTVCGNRAGCKECPRYIKDAVASWLVKGFTTGPVEEAKGRQRPK